MPAMKRFLVVRLAGREFAVAAARICGMLQMRGLEMQPLEGFGALRYLASLHGRTLPVYVANEALGLKPQTVSARSCLLLVRGEESPLAEGSLDSSAARCALVVDSISRLEDLPPSCLKLPAQVRLGEKWRDVLDLEMLCAHVTPVAALQAAAYAERSPTT